MCVRAYVRMCVFCPKANSSPAVTCKPTCNLHCVVCKWTSLWCKAHFLGATTWVGETCSGIVYQTLLQPNTYLTVVCSLPSRWHLTGCKWSEHLYPNIKRRKEEGGGNTCENPIYQQTVKPCTSTCHWTYIKHMLGKSVILAAAAQGGNDHMRSIKHLPTKP